MGVGAAKGGVTATVGLLLNVKIIQDPSGHYIAGPDRDIQATVHELYSTTVNPGH